MKPSISEYFRHNVHHTPLPALIDELAHLHRDHPMISLPRDNHDVAAGYRDISYGDFSRAVNRAASWIVDTLGSCSTNFEVLHYVAPQDLSYMIIMLAAVKTGYQTLTCHPAAEVDTHLSLIEKTNCRILLHPSPGHPKANAIQLRQPDLMLITTPSLDSWLSESYSPMRVYPYEKPLADALSDPFAIIHTSASTGAAKPIYMTHATMTQQSLAFARCQSLATINFTHWQDRRVALLTPLSIAAGLYNVLGINIFFNLTIVLPIPGVRMSAAILDDVLQHGRVTACILSPKFLRDTCANPTYLHRLRCLQHLAVVGAPFPTDLGPIMRAHTRLAHIYGSSEANIFPVHTTDDPEDWAYMKLDPVLSHEFRPVVKGYHELVLLRNDEGRCQSAFYMFPHMQDYPMKDLFVQHPRKKDLWRYCGRIDDLTNSETEGRFLPREMEMALEAHPGITAAVLCDEKGGDIPVLLEVDPALVGGGRREDWIDSIWSAVEIANEKCPIDNASIKKHGVIFVHPDRPLPIGVKGFPQRAASKTLYAAEIMASYRRI
ncbi:hypothetical protein EYZ11_000204 [Aspergillus tanneri]|uniref:AMP-dependent synthetase/ligase domain-containing protein n=1 Tax=Aspergillus tanneri TaxID=1220188 RepID=A0A4V3UQU0_9EURO|nr:uncharacterized protein ATNIH1004_006412 [Aspergillus tanneri]KAA8647715.1 hypothetical protein ATNIH1004_006412 [Aspergillus tanneri]THD00311.1 hypothetical protein EYZ11_000204 [Aspergillus tanneri]